MGLSRWALDDAAGRRRPPAARREPIAPRLGGGGARTNREMNNLKIENNESTHRWEAHLDQHLAVAEYRRRGETIFFIHTEVPRELDGQGVASQLVKTALDDARTQHLVVVPFCPFVAG